MITLKEVENIHSILIKRFGGSLGIRDAAGLDAAINRPYQTFDQHELYPEAIDKAAAIFESIISNHPFIDGNKRTAYVLMRLILMENNQDIKASENEKYDFVINAAQGKLTFQMIRGWITDHIIKVN